MATHLRFMCPLNNTYSVLCLLDSRQLQHLTLHTRERGEMKTELLSWFLD